MMPHVFSCLFSLLLMAYDSCALITRNEQRRINKEASVPQSTGNGTQVQDVSLMQKASSSFPVLLHMNARDAVLVRPSAGEGPDYVKFGLTTKNFYGARMQRFTFAVDMVMSLAWQDHRVAHLIPNNLPKLTMSLNQALTKIWMPGIVVTNKDIEKYEVISSSVTIYPSGNIIRVERAQVKCLWKFELQDYPFDTQNLQVKVASSKYMFDEVILVPDNNISGVDETVWGLYSLEGWDTGVYNDTDGHLQKSRGFINMKITRHLDKYFDDHLVPCAICLGISWAVFYFPFAGPFITPRLALSIIALLTFTNLMIKSIKELPGSAPFNWNDLFNQQIQTMMFCTIVLNITSEIVHHQFKNETLAQRMNNHAKVLIPIMSIFNITIIIGGGMYHAVSVRIATYYTKTVVFLIVGVYAGYIGYGVWSQAQQNKGGLVDAGLGEDADADADGGDGDGGDGGA